MSSSSSGPPPSQADFVQPTPKTTPWVQSEDNLSWRVPPLFIEWILAAMLGVGIAFSVAGVIVYLEMTRFDPPPTQPQTHEWGTQRTKPTKSSSASASASHPPEKNEVEEPVLDLSIEGSAVISASSAGSPIPEIPKASDDTH